MFKLIESNGKNIKEVLSSGRTIWGLYEEYNVEIDLRESGAFVYINNVPDTLSRRHNSTFISTTKFKELFSHMEILGVKFDLSQAISVYYVSHSSRITIQHNIMKRTLSTTNQTVFNDKIKLHYKE